MSYLEVRWYQCSKTKRWEHFIAGETEKHMINWKRWRMYRGKDKCWIKRLIKANRNPIKQTFIRVFGLRGKNPVCVSALAKWWLMDWCLPVIVLADLPYSHQCFEVLIWLVGVDVVEGAAVSGIPVGCCEVYCHLEQKQHTHIHSQWARAAMPL